MRDLDTAYQNFFREHKKAILIKVILNLKVKRIITNPIELISQTII